MRARLALLLLVAALTSAMPTARAVEQTQQVRRWVSAVFDVEIASLGIVQSYNIEVVRLIDGTDTRDTLKLRMVTCGVGYRLYRGCDRHRVRIALSESEFELDELLQTAHLSWLAGAFDITWRGVGDLGVSPFHRFEVGDPADPLSSRRAASAGIHAERRAEVWGTVFGRGLTPRCVRQWPWVSHLCWLRSATTQLVEPGL